LGHLWEHDRASIGVASTNVELKHNASTISF
jgi:hypothetical protein